MKDIVVLDGELDLIISQEAELKLEHMESGEFGITTIVNTDKPYTGNYTIVPILNEDIIMETRGRLMTDDVTIKEIPVISTSNLYGGRTVVIG